MGHVRLDDTHGELVEQHADGTWTVRCLSLSPTAAPLVLDASHLAPLYVNFEELTYPDFHRHFNVCRFSDLTQRARTSGAYWPLDEASARYVELRPTARPVWWDWLLPGRHYNRFYYQLLLLRVPFRECVPSAFVLPHNTTGSLQEECERRALFDGGSETAHIESEATRRNFSPEQVRSMVEDAQMDDWLDFMQGANDDDLGAAPSSGRDAVALDDAEMGPQAHARQRDRLQDAIARSACDQPRPVAPRIVDGVWEECDDDGRPRLAQDGSPRRTVLKQRQLVAFELLKDGGARQLLTFLSGEGGMGKSTLIRLLDQHWRAQGYRVIICAASGKAANLINGFTVHSAFGLRDDGGCTTSRLLNAAQGTAHFRFLATADIVVIDEISMLPASVLDVVSEVLNVVVRQATGQRLENGVAFGLKSLIGVGDLFQLPAIERLRFEDQVYQSCLWPRFKLIELLESCRVNADEVEFASLLSRARLGHAHMLPSDWTLLETRVCANHCPDTYFSRFEPHVSAASVCPRSSHPHLPLPHVCAASVRSSWTTNAFDPTACAATNTSSDSRCVTALSDCAIACWHRDATRSSASASSTPSGFSVSILMPCSGWTQTTRARMAPPCMMARGVTCSIV